MTVDWQGFCDMNETNTHCNLAQLLSDLENRQLIESQTFPITSMSLNELMNRWAKRLKYIIIFARKLYHNEFVQTRLLCLFFWRPKSSVPLPASSYLESFSAAQLLWVLLKCVCDAASCFVLPCVSLPSAPPVTYLRPSVRLVLSSRQLPAPGNDPRDCSGPGVIIHRYASFPCELSAASESDVQKLMSLS